MFVVHLQTLISPLASLSSQFLPFTCVTGKLAWATIKGVAPRDTSSLHYWTTEDVLYYEPFDKDFGPLHLGCVYRFTELLDAKLKQFGGKKKIIYYSSPKSDERANSACLIGCYMILRYNKTGEAAYKPFLGIQPPFTPYRDASYGPSTFNLAMVDVLKGLHRATNLGWFKMETFDLQEYEFYEKVEHGDFNWVLPGKFLAFCGPHAVSQVDYDGVRTFTPEDYVPYFKKHNITTVVRLNKKVYDRKKFTEAGLDHQDLFFLDGSVPNDQIIRKFIKVCEDTKGGVAVHCKAGLGRTGTLIACYMMKHYKFTAAEAIGWIRLARPGSVLGPQQLALVELQPKVWRWGDRMRKRQANQDGGKDDDDEAPTETKASKEKYQPSPSKAFRNTKNNMKKIPNKLAGLGLETGGGGRGGGRGGRGGGRGGAAGRGGRGGAAGTKRTSLNGGASGSKTAKGLRGGPSSFNSVSSTSRGGRAAPRTQAGRAAGASATGAGRGGRRPNAPRTGSQQVSARGGGRQRSRSQANARARAT